MQTEVAHTERKKIGWLSYKQVSHPDSIETPCIANIVLLLWMLQAIQHRQRSLFFAPAPCCAPRDVQEGGPQQQQR